MFRALGAMRRASSSRGSPSEDPTLLTRAVTVGGVSRPYWISAVRESPSRILLALHGRGSTAPEQARYSGLGRLASEGRAYVVFPQGTVPGQRRGYTWADGDDAPYLEAVLSAVRSESGIDGRGAYLSGMSGGARVASHFASTHASAVAGLAAVAGLRAPLQRPSLPVRVIALHGAGDRINPYAGGSESRWAESVPDAAASWARANGLDGAPVEQDLSPTLHRTTWGSGAPGEVTLWTVRNGGHTWPGHLPYSRFGRSFLGTTSMEIDATEEIARVFF